MFYSPLIVVIIAVFIVAALLVLAIIQVGIINYAFTRIGIPADLMLTMLLLSIAGSFINIPVARLPQEEVLEPGVVNYFGMAYRVPRLVRHKQTLVAVNVGGALVPLAISAYLFARSDQILVMSAGILLVGIVTYSIAKPIKGVGIAVPTLVAPLLAAFYAVIATAQTPAAVAYVAGTMGTLFGADIANLPKIRDLGAPVVSIGGAGTFDGIFVTGIIAVLLASW